MNIATGITIISGRSSLKDSTRQFHPKTSLCRRGHRDRIRHVPCRKRASLATKDKRLRRFAGGDACNPNPGGIR